MARILLVDDEEPVRGFLKRGLELDGHEVAVAIDGQDATEHLAACSGDVDLLLTDIRMPLMDGIALAHGAKRDYPGLRIVMMTGYAEQRERASTLEGIVSEVLAKPFSLSDLRNAIGRALSRAV